MGFLLANTPIAKYFKNEGKAAGIVIGEKKKALEIAIKLLQKGFSIDDVADNTGLTVEIVKKLKH